MGRKSDNFPLVLLVSGLVLWLLLHTIWNILFEDWIKHQFEQLIGHTVAEMIERSGSVGFPAIIVIGIVWFLYRYIKAYLKADLLDPITEAQRQPQLSSLPTWIELERRFRELEPALQFSRIDGQTGAAGEYWRFAGGGDRDAEARFNATAAMASVRLFQDFPDEVTRHKEIAMEIDPSIRWYKALQYIGNRYESSPHIVREVNDDGSPGGFLYTGAINRPADASATLCLALASRLSS